MSRLHKGKKETKNIEPKKERREPLCSNEVSTRRSFLDLYYQPVAESEENLNRAFNILFEEVMKTA